MIELGWILSLLLVYIVYKDVENHPEMDKFFWVVLTFLFPMGLGALLYWLKREKYI